MTGLDNMLGGLSAGIINNFAADMRARAQRKWSEKMMDKQNDWSLMMWNKTNEYNDPRNQVARLESAGLNPLYYGLDGSSANGLESATPLGYQRGADTIGIGNPIEMLQQGTIRDEQAANIAADTENKNMNTRLQSEQAAGTGLDNWFKQQTMDARVDAEYLKNELTRKQMREIDKHVDEIEQNIKESIARTDSEVVKQALMYAQKHLANMQANEIAELLPYRKLLMDAQTEAQHMAASADFTHSLYEAGLIDAGYIDALTREANARAHSEEEKAALEAWSKGIKTGTLANYMPEGTSKFWKGIMQSFSGLLSAISMIADALGPLSSVVGAYVGGRAVGRGAKTAVEEGVNPHGKAGHSIAYDPNDPMDNPRAFGMY